jgi:hypothetical protein
MKPVAIIIVVIAGCIIASVPAMLSFLSHYQSDEAKLARGEITVFDYCSHLGKAAENETKCKQFLKQYGYNPF